VIDFNLRHYKARHPLGLNMREFVWIWVWAQHMISEYNYKEADAFSCAMNAMYDSESGWLDCDPVDDADDWYTDCIYNAEAY